MANGSRTSLANKPAFLPNLGIPVGKIAITVTFDGGKGLQMVSHQRAQRITGGTIATNAQDKRCAKLSLNSLNRDTRADSYGGRQLPVDQYLQAGPDGLARF